MIARIQLGTFIFTREQYEQLLHLLSNNKIHQYDIPNMANVARTSDMIGKIIGKDVINSCLVTCD